MLMPSVSYRTTLTFIDKITSAHDSLLHFLYSTALSTSTRYAKLYIYEHDSLFKYKSALYEPSLLFV